MCSVRTGHRASLCAFIGLLLLAGCEKEQQTDKAEADAGAEAGADLAQIDPELAQASSRPVAPTRKPPRAALARSRAGARAVSPS